MQKNSYYFNNNNSRRIWQHEEVMALLTALTLCKQEYNNIRTKSDTLKHILRDLQTRGILTTQTTLMSMRLKLKYLRKCWKDFKLGGNTPAGFSFYYNMCEEIWGHDSASHRRGSSATNGGNRMVLRSKMIPNYEEISLSSSKDEENDKRVKEAKQKYFNGKMSEIKQMLRKKNNILEHYFIEKQKLKEKARLAKDRRHREKTKLIEALLKGNDKLKAICLNV